MDYLNSTPIRVLKAFKHFCTRNGLQRSKLRFLKKTVCEVASIINFDVNKLDTTTFRCNDSERTTIGLFFIFTLEYFIIICLFCLFLINLWQSRDIQLRLSHLLRAFGRPRIWFRVQNILARHFVTCHCVGWPIMFLIEWNTWAAECPKQVAKAQLDMAGVIFPRWKLFFMQEIFKFVYLTQRWKWEKKIKKGRDEIEI